MADEKIEVEIVLDDGSIVKGFAKINDEAEKSAKKVERSLGGALRKPLNTSGIDKSISRITSGVFNFRNALIGGLAIFGGGALIKNFANLASVQQDAVNALNNSLRTAGTFSVEASQGFQEFASSLQAASTFGDEVIIQQIALARNFTKTNAEAQKLTKAAVELSAATGISLDSAVKNLGKTFGGLTGELGESVPALRNLTAEQLKAGAAIDLVLDRFGGSALSQTQTYSGSIQQLSNTFGDLLESVGSVITESPAIISLFNSLSTTFSSLNSSISGGSADINGFFTNLVINSAAAVNAIIDSFGALAQIPSFFEFVFLKAKLRTQEFVLSFRQLLQPVQGFVDRIFGGTERSSRLLAENLASVADTKGRLDQLASGAIGIADSFNTAKVVVEDFITTFQAGNLAAVAPGGAEVVNSPASSLVAAVDKDLVKLRERITMAQTDIRQQVQDIFLNPEELLSGSGDLFGSLADKSTEDLKRIGAGLINLKETTIAQTTQIQEAIRNGLGRAIASSVSAMVTALQEGGNALSAFAKSFLGVIGDLAIQIGTTLISSGLGLQALFALNGFAAVAAGVGLVAIGTILKSFSGGGSSNTVPSGQDAVTSPVLGGGDSGVTDGLEGGGGSSVNVVVEGNIFDSSETGLRIADVLKEQGFQNAVIT